MTDSERLAEVAGELAAMDHQRRAHIDARLAGGPQAAPIDETRYRDLADEFFALIRTPVAAPPRPADPGKWLTSGRRG